MVKRRQRCGLGRLGAHQLPLGWRARRAEAIASTLALRPTCWAKSMAVRPFSLRSEASAPSSISTLSTSLRPYMAAIISGVLPLGEAASM